MISQTISIPPNTATMTCTLTGGGAYSNFITGTGGGGGSNMGNLSYCTFPSTNPSYCITDTSRLERRVDLLEKQNKAYEEQIDLLIKAQNESRIEIEALRHYFTNDWNKYKTQTHE